MAFWKRKIKAPGLLGGETVCSRCGSGDLAPTDLPLEWRGYGGWVCNQCGFLKLRDSQGKEYFPWIMGIDTEGGRKE